ncbi:MAG TPA: dihydrolipoamide acetyltransferase family protein [Micromonosporaceae bacterium]|jgi:pyruvate dehydrogenase E2 component (dihydrolipoamide acetyltransferase)
MSRLREFALPDLGEGLTEGEIIKWLVAEGDTVLLNQPIVEVETAKAAVEIPAKWAGRVLRIHQPEGATVQVGSPIILIDTDPSAGDLPEPAAPATAEQAQTGEAAPGGRTAVLVGYGPRTTTPTRRPRVQAPTSSTVDSQTVTAAPDTAAPPPSPVEPATAPVLAKPPVRKLARDLGVDLDGIVGSGPSGSITRDDVHAAAAGEFSTATAGTAELATLVTPTSLALFGPNREHRVPVRGVRKLTAQNMVASAFTAPHVTEFLSVDMTRSMKALARLKERPDWRDTRVSPLLLVAKATLLAIRRHPMVNSTWSAGSDPDAPEIVVKEYVNLGIAAATPRGLLVPNIKDAGRLSLRELADAMTALVVTARDGRTAPADMIGGTFTITNVGVFGVDSGTPILPPGEAAILAFGAVRPTPWVHKGKVRVRDVTTLGLSFDHRIIDGELGSLFLRDIGSFLADPEGSLLGWG